MNNLATDVAALRGALAVAADGLVWEKDLDEHTSRVLRRYQPTLHGSATDPYWPAADIEDVLGGYEES